MHAGHPRLPLCKHGEQVKAVAPSAEATLGCLNIQGAGDGPVVFVLCPSRWRLLLFLGVRERGRWLRGSGGRNLVPLGPQTSYHIGMVTREAN